MDSDDFSYEDQLLNPPIFLHDIVGAINETTRELRLGGEAHYGVLAQAQEHADQGVRRALQDATVPGGSCKGVEFSNCGVQINITNLTTN